MTYPITVIQECPDILELEQQLLANTNIHSIKERTNASHVRHCALCRQKLNEIDGIYGSIITQLNSTIANNVLDFACKISCLPVQKGYFSCMPAHKKTKPPDKAYLIKMVYPEQSAGNKTFTQIGENSLTGAEFDFRAIADPESNNLVLYFSRYFSEFYNYFVTIPGIIEQVNYSSNGTVLLPYIAIEELNNKYIYFTRYVKSNKKKRILDIFQESLSIENELAC